MLLNLDIGFFSSYCCLICLCLTDSAAFVKLVLNVVLSLCCLVFAMLIKHVLGMNLIVVMLSLKFTAPFVSFPATSLHAGFTETYKRGLDSKLHFLMNVRKYLNTTDEI